MADGVTETREERRVKMLRAIFSREKGSEETGEVLQAISKLGTYGATATDPETGIQYDNIKALKEEVTDLLAAVAVILDGEVGWLLHLPHDIIIHERFHEKKEKIRQQLAKRIKDVASAEEVLPV